jgi:hypothetical protein
MLARASNGLPRHRRVVDLGRKRGKSTASPAMALLTSR